MLGVGWGNSCASYWLVLHPVTGCWVESNPNIIGFVTFEIVHVASSFEEDAILVFWKRV